MCVHILKLLSEAHSHTHEAAVKDKICVRVHIHPDCARNRIFSELGISGPHAVPSVLIPVPADKDKKEDE